MRTLAMDIGGNREFTQDFLQYDKIITDRGSVYSVTIGRVTNSKEIRSFLKRIKSNSDYASASHNSYAVRIEHNGALYETHADDGETGAGKILLRELQKHSVKNVCVCVTRWFGGEKLMSDRFKHIQDAARYALKNS
ncbi:MAG: YigZ family protein [Minisyncoccia bacterium]